MGGITGVGKSIGNFFTGGGNDEDKENESKTTGSKNKQKTQTTASKTEDENTKYAGLGGDPSEYETQINPDSKVNYERTSAGSGNSIYNTLKTNVPAKLAKNIVQSDTAVKPTPNEEDLKQQDENSKLNFKNAIAALFGKTTGTKTSTNGTQTTGGKTAEGLININEDSTDEMANDMTKSQLLVSKSFSKQQKTLSDTYKSSSKKMDKSTKSMSKELDKQVKKFQRSTKKTFTMFNSKMGSMLKIMNGANVNASSGSVSSSGGGLIGGIVDAVNNPNKEDGTPKDAFDVAKDIAGSVIDSVTGNDKNKNNKDNDCLLYTSPSPRD